MGSECEDGSRGTRDFGTWAHGHTRALCFLLHGFGYTIGFVPETTDLFVGSISVTLSSWRTGGENDRLLQGADTKVSDPVPSLHEGSTDTAPRSHSSQLYYARTSDLSRHYGDTEYRSLFLILPPAVIR